MFLQISGSDAFFAGMPPPSLWQRLKAWIPSRPRHSTTVAGHFQLLGKVFETYKVKQEHVYNVDEKGLQLGGGWKNLPTQFIFCKGDQEHYVLRSDSLVLVTLIEAVCADGSAFPPIFILPKGSVGPWWENPSVGS